MYYDSGCNYIASGWIHTGRSFNNPDSDGNKSWYYMENGRMKTGWLSYNGCWYFLANTDSDGNGYIDGYMYSNSTDYINGSYYTFGPNGGCRSGSGCSSSCN